MTTPDAPLAPADLAAIERRAVAATTLPWVLDESPGLCGHDADRYHVIAAPEAAVDVVALVPRVEGAEVDVAYLALAANSVPALLAEVRRLTAALDAQAASEAARVAAAVAAERKRVAGVLRGVMARQTGAKADAIVRECADAIAATTGGA